MPGGFFFVWTLDNPQGIQLEPMATAPNKGAFKKGEKRPNQGRPPGKPNGDTALIRDMVAKALNEVGGVQYLASVAQSHPGPFLALVGKVIPVQVTGADGGAVQHAIRVTFG